MAKNQTSWANNITKTRVTWANNDVKPNTSWVNNITKAATAYATTAKNNSTWSGKAVTQTPYLYDSASITYDSAVYSYDYTTSVTNQTNDLNPTPWSAT